VYLYKVSNRVTSCFADKRALLRWFLVNVSAFKGWRATKTLMFHSRAPMKWIWVKDHCIIQTPLLSPEWLMSNVVPQTGSLLHKYLGIGNQTWFGLHWDDIFTPEKYLLIATQEGNGSVKSCGWVCRIDPTLSHSYELGQVSVLSASGL